MQRESYRAYPNAFASALGHEKFIHFPKIKKAAHEARLLCLQQN